MSQVPILVLSARAPQGPDETEQHTNPRSASARLRAAERLSPSNGVPR